MARFDAAAEPRAAIERGHYVEPLGRSFKDQLIGRIELRPASTHLLVGGIGSGKTTELLIAAERLDAYEDINAVYVDISERHDLDFMSEGVTTLIAGMALSIKFRAKLRPIGGEAIRDFFWEEAYGSSESGAALVPPRRAPNSQVDPSEPNRDRLKTALVSIYDGLTEGKDKHVVLFIDSLDRMTDMDAFERVVQEDVTMLKWAGFGVVLVGPQKTLYSADRAVEQRFDYFYQQPFVDVQNNDEGFRFLVKVLRARSDEDLLPVAACHRLAEQSGGVLRDLVSLAQSAGEEAYLSGADQILVEHVDRAADAFGRKLMLGLRTNEIETLQRVRTKGTFVAITDDDLALLVTRRVLTYTSGPGPRYAVHPTIAPLLRAIDDEEVPF